MPAFTHAIGFDDVPFGRQHRGDVRIIGTVWARTTLHGVVSGKVRRDGRNSTSELARLTGESLFRPHLHLILLQGVALAGFNVVDAYQLSEVTRLPVLIVARREPNMDRIRAALLEQVPGGKRKWKLIEKLGPMEPLREVWVQRVNISEKDAGVALHHLTLTGNIPEPLRSAHLIAGGVGTGHSRGRT
ncbi:DUF99 family protein [Deinococcus sp.]|uniref:endonuclease dU n=1 Tax=Deinococcus sp. TaxID=47478 RepID=UPI0025D30068|nr:DUF99 family protein [Deinococcus sp.]